VRKHCSNPQCFFSRKKLQNQIINQLNMKKTKIDKDNSGKKKKNHIGKHCSNQQCFKEKTTKLNS
jgi:hypothetical protein